MNRKSHVTGESHQRSMYINYIQFRSKYNNYYSEFAIYIK